MAVPQTCLQYVMAMNMMIFIWLLVGFVLYYSINNNTSAAKIDGSTPEEILKERYVNGEIDKMTFEKMKKTMNGGIIMMYGRGYYGRGFNGNSGCFGYGFFNHGWNMFIAAGVLIILALLIYLFVHNRKKKISAYSAFEILKIKYAKGEITEEEFLKRKDILERS
ncbi:MAG: SHOCT domain-containing protein [Anaerocolumna sp.]